MTDELAEQEAFVLRAKAAQERADTIARNVREFREAEAKAKAVHIEHADHAMQCGDCDNLYKRIASLERMHMNQAETIMEMQATIARLERKAKKWKRRAKAAEALTYSKANLDAGFKHRITETPWEPKPSHSREALAFAEAQDPELTHRTYWIDNGSRGSLLGPWVCMCGKTGETIETKAAHELATA